ncbi:polysaccharide biosynthesis protein [Hyphobacterium sp. CCMP332]|uniref:polysaccharide biosynthesis protein n=1 Tax=Hyphobacterium sp. CCMP332 TaxID=2749086 RepID=UPI00164F9DCF|nr:polysaccharide biosynthesis protein [Hyphobacterium sp. CCMP332]
MGRALVDQLLKYDVERVIAIDNNESELFFLGTDYAKDNRLVSFLLDISDTSHLYRRLIGVDYVIHAAAFKHVPLCEQSPVSAVRNNITGTQSVIDAARRANVKKVLFTSSDKAVNPTNVMGTSKLMGERLITAANLDSSNNRTKFASTRFGNVIGSRGSVFPIFRDQIKKRQPITLTHPDMTRFMMTLDESVRLVLNSLALMVGGEVFVTKMPVVCIKDFAEALVDYYAKQDGFDRKEVDIHVIGLRPGEKLFEELTTSEEVNRSYEIDDFIVVLPGFKVIYEDFDFTTYKERGEPSTEVYDSSKRAKLDNEASLALVREAGLIT